MSFLQILTVLLAPSIAVDCSSKSSYISSDSTYPFSLMTLPYDLSFLDPFLPQDLINSHFNRRHQSYVDKLNSYLKQNSDLQSLTLTELNELAENYEALQKFAGGNYNHDLYWWVLTNPACASGTPQGSLLRRIEKSWGSLDGFFAGFNNTLRSVLGSGWVWGCVNMTGGIEIRKSRNEVNSLMQIESTACYSFLGCDVWEHAFYLRYNWDRQEYFNGFFTAIDWEVVELFYESYASNLLAVPF